MRRFHIPIRAVDIFQEMLIVWLVKFEHDLLKRLDEAGVQPWARKHYVGRNRVGLSDPGEFFELIRRYQQLGILTGASGVDKPIDDGLK